MHKSSFYVKACQIFYERAEKNLHGLDKEVALIL
jgi:hypothetical protein